MTFVCPLKELFVIINYAKRRKYFFLFIVISYLTLLTVLCITRFRLISYIAGNDSIRDYSFNLIPFHSIIANWKRIGKLSWDAFGNMLMFIPLGVIYCFFQRKKSFALASLYCLVSSVGIELFQYIFSTGAVDVDDVILNTVGSLIGILVYHIIYAVFKKKSSSEKELIEVLATIFPPFLLFYMADMTWGMGKYCFSLWHAIPIVAYFAVIGFVLFKDFSTKANVVYYLSAFLFSLYFFGIFM